MVLLKNDGRTKVVKVFTHEEEAKFDFDKVNEELFESAYQANKYANILNAINWKLRIRKLCVSCGCRWCSCD